MVDNLAEKADECPLNHVNQDRKNCLLYGVAGCLLFRVAQVLKWMKGQSGLSELSVISWVSTVEGAKQGSTVYVS